MQATSTLNQTLRVIWDTLLGVFVLWAFWVAVSVVTWVVGIDAQDAIPTELWITPLIWSLGRMKLERDENAFALANVEFARTSLELKPWA